MSTKNPEVGTFNQITDKEGEPMPAIRVITHKDLFGPESEPLPIDAMVKVCEDDDIVAGPRTALIGEVASGEVELASGDQEVYPDSDRKAMQRVAPISTRIVGEIAEEQGVSYGETSHPGCGGGNAQDIPADRLAERTRSSVEGRGGRYLGHLQVSEAPQSLEDETVQTSITRPEEDHHHTAKYVAITVDSGINGKEKRAFVDKFGPVFQISADYFARALEEGVSKDDLRAILNRQIEIARAIAPGVKENDDPILIYNAGRRVGDQEEVAENIRIVQEMLN